MTKKKEDQTIVTIQVTKDSVRFYDQSGKEINRKEAEALLGIEIKGRDEA